MPKMMLLVAVCAAFASLGLYLIGPDSVHTVSWYMAHPEEREALVGGIGRDNAAARGFDYQNALEAHLKADANSFMAAARQAQ